MKKLLLILTFASLTQHTFAMDDVRKEQEEICRENQRRIDLRVQENERITASRKSLNGKLITGCLLCYSTIMLIQAMNNSSAQNKNA